MKKFIIPMFFVAAMLGQTAPTRKQAATTKPSIDAVIELVQGGMSEPLVIQSLRSQGTPYKLSPADLVKLQKAGVSESIIAVMTDPKAPVAASTVRTSPALPSASSSAPPGIAAAKDP